jgi:hypothetical protein
MPQVETKTTDTLSKYENNTSLIPDSRRRAYPEVRAGDYCHPTEL